MPCVIKFDHEEGIPLKRSKLVLWCGKESSSFEWYFMDAQHAALADKPVCNSCRANIKRALDNKE